MQFCTVYSHFTRKRSVTRYLSLYLSHKLLCLHNTLRIFILMLIVIVTPPFLKKKICTVWSRCKYISLLLYLTGFWRMLKSRKGGLHSVASIAVTPAVLNDESVLLNIYNMFFKQCVKYLLKQCVILWYKRGSEEMTLQNLKYQ